MSDRPQTLDYASSASDGIPAAVRQRGLFFLGLAVGATGFAMALQGGLNNNFLVEEFAIIPTQIGVLEAARESCGIVAFAFLAILAGLAEPLIGMAVLILFAAGIGSYAFVPSFYWVVGMSMVWSQGLHIWMPLPNSMGMALAEPGHTGRRLGQIGAAGAAGTFAGLGVALVLTLLHVPMRPMYLVACGVAVAAAVACLGIPRNIKTPGPRFVLRRRYGLFYLLSFLEGWRKQIFICFAGYLLVREYHTPLWMMLTLGIIVQTIGWLTARRVGHLIDRVGERRVLVFYYSCLTVFFLCYAGIPNKYALFCLFVLDNSFFVFATALNTYVNRIAPKSEHTATLSMGVATNHVASVIVPVIGGTLWVAWGRQWPFLIGSAAAMVSIVAALRIPRHLPEAVSEPLSQSATATAEAGEGLTEEMLR